MIQARLMTTETLQLLDAAREGDEASRGKLLSGYERYLTLLARVQIGRRLQGKVDAEDLVQEVFLDAHRQFPNFRGTSEGELTAWLRRILAGRLSLSLRHYLGVKGRDLKLERELEADVDNSSRAMDRGLADSITSPSMKVQKREQAVLLAEALEHLPPDYREVIILRHLQQLSFAEVSAKMQRSEDSVQKLWVRALGQLRTALGSAK
jgi:RNA polymerase sigma-70 factor, ECF subfamily